MLKHFNKLFEYRELLYNIALREIKIRYKQSIFGIAWAIMQPLSTMVIFTVIFSRFAKIPSDGIPYPIFSYSALLPWTFFASALSSAIPSLVSNINLVTKIYFPREIFPLASVMAAFIDFVIASVVFVGMMVFYKVELNGTMLFVIIILPIQILFTMSISLFASAINVYYRDVRYALPLIIQLWMYASPIVYPVSIVPERYRAIYMLNPMAGIIDSYRRVILKGLPPDFFYLGIAFLSAAILFFAAYSYFKYVEMNFADII